MRPRCVVFVGVNHCAARADAPPRARHLVPRDRPLQLREPLDRPRARRARRRASRCSGSSNPWLIPFALAPLVLIHRSLSVPALQAEARDDPKTGLFNARHFAAALHEELARAHALRPAAVADHGRPRPAARHQQHVRPPRRRRRPGGSRATSSASELRHYDVPARFGGEEFSILLPETTPQQALEIAERIRRAVAAQRFDVETSSEPIHATVSIGVASLPARRQRRERARPPGGPRRLPRQAPGPKPRRSPPVATSRVLAQADRPRAAPRSAVPRRCRAGARGRCRPARRARVGAGRRGSPGAAAARARGPALLLDLRPPRALVGASSARRRRRSASSRLVHGTEQRRRSRCSSIARSSAGARRSHRGRRRERSRSALSARSPARRSSGRAPALVLALTTVAVDWSARRTRLAPAPLQRRRADAGVARGAGVFASLRGRRDRRSHRRRLRRGHRLLRRSTPGCARSRSPSRAASGVAEPSGASASCWLLAALRRLRLHRRA